MGSVGKALGRAAARSLESESARILRTCPSNKVSGSLSLALDGTLKQGHDMRVFGLGTAAAWASVPRYARFTSSMHAVYSEMEAQLDAAAPTDAAAAHDVWHAHAAVLRRAPALARDLADVGVNVGALAAGAAPPCSAATARYVARVRAAGEADRADGGARILGHLYCRYFADLFGGSVLGAPTRYALALPPHSPAHYDFSFPNERRPAVAGRGDEGGDEGAAAAPMRRGEYIESLYASLNGAGASLAAPAFDDVVDEALAAFASNVEVYSEEPMLLDAARGSLNVATGYVGARLAGVRQSAVS